MKKMSIVAFACGAGYLIAFLVLNFFSSALTPLQLKGVQIALACFAAGVVLFILGLPAIKPKAFKLSIQFGGALAVFVLVSQTQPELQPLPGRGDASLKEAAAFQAAGDAAKARQLYAQAQRFYHQEENSHGQAQALRQLGDLERKTGQFEQARQAYLRASQLHQQLANRLGEAKVLRRLGDVERKAGQLEQAHQAYAKAQQLYQLEKAPIGEAKILGRLGDLERKAGQLEQAHEAYTKARLLFQQEGDQAQEARILLKLGQLHTATDPELAQQYFSEASQLRQAANRPKQSPPGVASTNPQP